MAQAVHAAGFSSRLGPELPADTHAVVVTVADEPALLRLEVALQQQGIAHSPIREPDEPYAGALMAIGIQPQSRGHVLRSLTGALPLYKGKVG